MMATLVFSELILLIKSKHLSGAHKYENNDFLMYNSLMPINFFSFKSHLLFLSTVSQSAFVCLKCTMKTQELCVESVQN